MESHNAPRKKLAATYSHPITANIYVRLTITEITSRLTSYTVQRQEPQWLESWRNVSPPMEFHSDNGPPFNFNEFSAFAAMYEFEHVTTSPEYPQSNGRVETQISSLPYWTGEILQLRVWRVHPDSGYLAGAPEPCCRPQENSWNPIWSETSERESYEGKKFRHVISTETAKKLPSLTEGDVVRVKLQASDGRNRWTKAQVEQQGDVRSYAVRTNCGDFANEWFRQRLVRQRLWSLRQRDESLRQRPDFSLWRSDLRRWRTWRWRNHSLAKSPDTEYHHVNMGWNICRSFLGFWYTFLIFRIKFLCFKVNEISVGNKL